MSITQSTAGAGGGEHRDLINRLRAWPTVEWPVDAFSASFVGGLMEEAAAALASAPPAPTPDAGSDGEALRATISIPANREAVIALAIHLAREGDTSLLEKVKAEIAKTSASPPPGEDLAGQGEPVANGWRLVPTEATRDWAYDLAIYRQGKSSTPRCEGPSQRDVEWGMDRIREVLAAAPTLAAADEPADTRARNIIREAAARIEALGVLNAALSSVGRDAIVAVLQNTLTARVCIDGVWDDLAWMQINGIVEAADAILNIAAAVPDARQTTAAEKAYGILWRIYGAGHGYAHDARQILRDGLDKEARQRGIAWATEQYGELGPDPALMLSAEERAELGRPVPEVRPED